MTDFIDWDDDPIDNVHTSSGGIDLHAHTTASDGSLSPTALVELAVATGLTAIAVTDHDTIGGLAEAAAAAGQMNIELVPGVELSVEDDSGRFHLLGYLFYPQDEKLSMALISIRESRAQRNVEMAEKMRELGLPVTMDDVRAEAGPDSQVIARPHFARALMKAGIVASVQEAFDKYLATGKPLYQPKQVLTPHDAIKLIHGAGGIAVMAHPGLVPLGDKELAARVASLAANDGMDGIEAHYSQHTAEQTKRFLQLALDNDLIVTAGSDFHGIPKPHVTLGVIENREAAPAILLDNMRLRAARNAATREVSQLL